MSERFDVSISYLDFGREVEISVRDALNPSRRMSIRIAELQIPDVEEMLQAILDKLATARSERNDTNALNRLLDAFQDGVNEARGDEDVPTT